MIRKKCGSSIFIPPPNLRANCDEHIAFHKLSDLEYGINDRRLAIDSYRVSYSGNEVRGNRLPRGWPVFDDQALMATVGTSSTINGYLAIIHMIELVKLSFRWDDGEYR